MNYKKNAKYFRARPSAKRAVIGALVVLGLFAVKIPLGIVGALVFAAFVYFAYFGRPADAEIDAQAVTMLADIKKRAFSKLGVEEEEVALASPIEFWGYEYGDVLKDEANRKALNIQGGDGIWRSCEVKIGGFYFSEDVVHFYWRTASLVSDAFKEGTEEYFYKDIVSVKTETGDFKINGQEGQYESFVLRNAGGESTVCSVSNGETAEAAVNAFRALLKQKKLKA